MKSYIKYLIVPILLISVFVLSRVYASNPVVTIETNMGSIVIELDQNKTTETTANFINHVKSGYYENTLFHRVISGFMVQGGGLNTDMSNKPPISKPIQNEADKGGKNKAGTIAMARTGYPHSATSQFFINVNDNEALDFTSKSNQGWGYCVFGKVIKGMDVVNKIKNVATTAKKGYQDVPVDNVVIIKATVA